jgi:hypothetical protein
MKTSNLKEAMTSYQVKDPHSKALEPDCLSPSISNRERRISAGENGCKEDL